MVIVNTQVIPNLQILLDLLKYVQNIIMLALFLEVYILDFYVPGLLQYVLYYYFILST